MEWILYSRGTQGGGALIKSTKSGGSTSVTSQGGGGQSVTSQSGGGQAVTTQGGGSHDHVVFKWNTEFPVGSPNLRGYKSRLWATGDEVDVNIEGPTADIKTYTASGEHSHNVQIPSHQHVINLNSHSHEVQIPSHSHEFELPSHQHDLEHGIFLLDRLPTEVRIEVDGNPVPGTEINRGAVDLVPYLAKDSNGKIRRGEWHTVTIIPNDLARINANIFGKFFIQSRGEYTV